MHGTRDGWKAELRERVEHRFWLKVLGITAFMWLFFVGYFHVLRHPSGPPTIMPTSPIVSGSLSLEWIIKSIEIDEDVDTIGGLAFVLAGHVPQAGETLLHESGWRIEITAGDARRATRLRLHPPVNAAVED